MTLSQMSQLVWQMVTVTVYHMTRVTWGPWESKHIAIVVKCISSREISENSIEFSLLNSEQKDSWLNFGHWTLDADRFAICWANLTTAKPIFGLEPIIKYIREPTNCWYFWQNLGSHCFSFGLKLNSNGSRVWVGLVTTLKHVSTFSKYSHWSINIFFNFYDHSLCACLGTLWFHQGHNIPI